MVVYLLQHRQIKSLKITGYNILSISEKYKFLAYEAEIINKFLN